MCLTHSTYLYEMECLLCGTNGSLDKVVLALSWRVKYKCVVITVKENAEYLIISTGWLGYHSWFTSYRLVLRRVHKMRKATIRFVTSVCTSEWKNLTSNRFHEIWYFSIFLKYVEKIQVQLNSYKNYGYFMWTPIYIYDHTRGI